MGKNILVLVDYDPTSKRAFKKALETFNPEAGDELFLINFYSSWDYLNEDRNAGKLALYEFKSYVETVGVITLSNVT